MTSIELTNPIRDLGPTDLDDPTDGYDFYREIHKGIRYAMFHTTMAVGRLDVADTDEVDRVLQAHRDLHDLLHLHHHHEDEFIQPLVVAHAPDLADVVEVQHGDVDDGLAQLARLGDRLASGAAPGRARTAHHLYLDLTRLTSAYLSHQLVEETEVMPALRAAVPTDELFALDMALRASVPPPVMADVVQFMLPAMNIDERADMVGGMSMAPPEVFAVFSAAAQSALSPADWAQLAGRLGLH
jgi:hypothetical protein